MYKKYGFQVKTYFMELPYSAFSVEKLTEEKAREICAWRYEGEYSVYNLPEWEECAKLGWSITDGEKRKTEYFAVHTEGQFLGYFHVMNREDSIELGVGIKPELCGKHYGQQLMHLALGKIEELYPGLPVKLTVRPFNKRAIKCYESVGFKIVEKYYESTYLVPGEMYIMELNRCL